MAGASATAWTSPRPAAAAGGPATRIPATCDILFGRMIDEATVTALARALESQQVERKQSLSDKSKVEQAICAYANDLPGTGASGFVFVGVTDAGAPAPTPVTDQLLRDLANIRSDGNILPFPHIDVYEAKLDGVPIAVVEVHPSPSPPVRLRGAVWIRAGPTSRRATRDEERVLVERRRAWDGPYDQTSVHGATIDDLDLELFRREYLPNAVDAETLRENQRSLPEQLAALHLADPDAVPNVAGLLVLGHEPTAFVKGAYIQFLRIDGLELADPVVDRRELRGPLPIVLRQMDELTRAHIRTATTIAGTDREVVRPDYPIDALQQLLRNAVMHRNYETSYAPVQWYWFRDRIEIHNPGGLFGRATPETFGNPGGNDYRNPTIAEALHALGYVQRFGFGVPMARRACADNGNLAPEFNFQPGNFAAIVRSA
jgi:ATP-dependent DNA helicase RecG